MNIGGPSLLFICKQAGIPFKCDFEEEEESISFSRHRLFILPHNCSCVVDILIAI